MELSSSLQQYIPHLEALLFVHGEALSLKKIAHMMHISEKECAECIDFLSTLLANDATRGLMLLRNGDMVQYATKPEFQKIYETLMTDEVRVELTPAGRETLALVAYCGPLTRLTIDYIRGVNSSFTLRNLLVRGLIERTQDPKNAHAFLYSVSMQFLSHIGIARKEDLPEYEKYRNILETFSSHTNDPVFSALS